MEPLLSACKEGSVSAYQKVLANAYALQERYMSICAFSVPALLGELAAIMKELAGCVKELALLFKETPYCDEFFEVASFCENSLQDAKDSIAAAVEDDASYGVFTRNLLQAQSVHKRVLIALGAALESAYRDFGLC